MTVFLVSPTLTAAAPLVSKDKGSFGNRMNCAGSQALNTAATAAAATAVIAGAGYAVKHSDKLTAVTNKGMEVFNKIKNSKIAQKTGTCLKKVNASGLLNKHFAGVKNSKFVQGTANSIKNLSTKVSNVFKSLPKGGKIGVAVALGAILLNGIYRSGQIDQKYTDRAKMEEHFV